MFQTEKGKGEPWVRTLEQGELKVDVGVDSEVRESGLGGGTDKASSTGGASAGDHG